MLVRRARRSTGVEGMRRRFLEWTTPEIVVWYITSQMLRRFVAVVVLAGVASAGLPLLRAAWGADPAGPRAVRLVSASGKRLSGQWQAWANASLVPTVAGQVVIKLTGCPGLPKAAGCVYTRQPRVIYLKRGLTHPRGVMLHELGHVYDLTVLSNRDRGEFRQDHAQAARAVVEGQGPARRVVRRGVRVVRALLADRVGRRVRDLLTTTRRPRSTGRRAR